METLEPLIAELVEMIKGTKEFTIAQAPDFVRQYLVSARIDTVGGIFWGVILAVAVNCLGRWLYRKWDDVDEVVCFFGTLFLIVLGIVSAWLITANIDDLLKIELAPKAYLVVHLSQLLK